MNLTSAVHLTHVIIFRFADLYIFILRCWDLSEITNPIEFLSNNPRFSIVKTELKWLRAGRYWAGKGWKRIGTDDWRKVKGAEHMRVVGFGPFQWLLSFSIICIVIFAGITGLLFSSFHENNKTTWVNVLHFVIESLLL